MKRASRTPPPAATPPAAPSIETVLDANVVNSISRAPLSPPNDRISAAVKRRRLKICVDQERGIVSEWERTANPEVVRQLIIFWEANQGWMQVPLKGALPAGLSRRLAQLGFTDTGDKLIVKTACSTHDRCIISNDPDFWDPTAKGKKNAVGRPNAPVAALLQDELGVTVMTLKDAVSELCS